MNTHCVNHINNKFNNYRKHSSAGGGLSVAPRCCWRVTVDWIPSFLRFFLFTFFPSESLSSLSSSSELLLVLLESSFSFLY